MTILVLSSFLFNSNVFYIGTMWVARYAYKECGPSLKAGAGVHGPAGDSHVNAAQGQ